MNVTEQDLTREVSALQSLADLLDSEKYRVDLIGNAGKRSCLRVSNRHAGALVELIYCIDGCYRWSWGDVVGSVSEVDYVANIVTRVLRVLGDDQS